MVAEGFSLRSCVSSITPVKGAAVSFTISLRERAGVRVPSTYISSTVILFRVRVPVLSVQMYVTEPRVSTAGSFLIRAFCLTIFLAPRARDMVTTAGRASGMAATAREMAVSSIRIGGSPLMIPTAKMMAHRAMTATASLWPNLASLFCKGVFTSSSV